MSVHAKEIIASGENEVFLSAASAWEIAIKTANGKLVLPEAPTHYIANRISLYRFRPLPIQISHAVHIYDLPPHHNDPFDRMLIAQSQLESIPLVTIDEDIRRYDLETLW